MERIIQALSCNEILGEHLQNQCNEAFQNRTHLRSCVADGVYVHRTYIWMCLCVCVLQQPRPVLLSQPKQIHHFKVIHYISCMPDILDVYQLIVHTQATSNKQPHRIVYKLQIIIIATDHHISGPLSLYYTILWKLKWMNQIWFVFCCLDWSTVYASSHPHRQSHQPEFHCRLVYVHSRLYAR